MFALAPFLGILMTGEFPLSGDVTAVLGIDFPLPFIETGLMQSRLPSKFPRSLV